MVRHAWKRELVLAAGKEDGQDIQIGIGEQPAVGMLSGRLRGADNGPEMLAAGHAMKVVQANPGKAGDFFVCEESLTGFDSDHNLRRIHSLCRLFDPAPGGPAVESIPGFGKPVK